MILTTNVNPKAITYCPNNFMDFDHCDGFCYRLERTSSVKNGEADNHCKTKFGGNHKTSISSKVMKDVHVSELARTKLKKVYLLLTLKMG